MGSRTTRTEPITDSSRRPRRPPAPSRVTSQPARAAAMAVFWTRESPVMPLATITSSRGAGTRVVMVRTFLPWTKRSARNLPGRRDADGETAAGGPQHRFGDLDRAHALPQGHDVALLALDGVPEALVLDQQRLPLRD